MERQAPGGVRGPPRRRPEPGPRAGGPRDTESRRVERVLLELRLRDGLPTGVLDGTGRAAVTGLADRGLLVEDDERLVLTRDGRLLADAAVRDLLP